MPQILTIKNKNEIILNDNDFRNLIQEHMGDEAVRYFDNIISQHQKQLKIAEDTTELDCYLSDLENNRDCFLEILDVIAKIDNLLKASRLQRQTLMDWLSIIKKLVNNQI